MVRYFSLPLLAFLALGCAHTTSFVYQPAVMPPYAGGLTLQVGEFANRTGYSNPSQIGPAVRLDKPAAQLVREMTSDQLKQAGFAVGSGNFLVTGTVHSLVFGSMDGEVRLFGLSIGKRMGSVVTFQLLRLPDSAAVYKKTIFKPIEFGGFFSTADQVRNVQECVVEFVNDPEFRFALGMGPQPPPGSRPPEAAAVTTSWPQPSAEPRRSDAAGAVPRMMNISVMNLNTTAGLSASEIVFLTDKLINELVNTNLFTVVERGRRDEILKEQGFQQSGACDNSTCLVEIGQLLGVQKMVGGTVGRFGQVYVVELRLIDVRTGRIDRAFSESYSDEVTSLLKAMREAAQYFARGGK